MRSPPRRIFVAGTIPSDGVNIVATPVWDLTSAPSWDPNVRWRVVEIGWIPTATGTPIFRLAADGTASDVFVLPAAGAAGAQVRQDVSWALPRAWTGRVQWLPGGQIFAGASGLPSDQLWVNNAGAVVWLQLEEIVSEQQAGRAAGGC